MSKKQMSILDAFLALEDVRDEDIKASITEGKGFNVRDNADMEKAKDFVDNQAVKDVALEVIDVDADSLEHLKNNQEYIGQMILQCNSCKANRFINADDLVESETDSEVYNIEDECPHCHGTGTGFHLIGQVGKVEEEEPEITNDSLTDEPKFDNDLEPETEEENTEAETEEEQEPEDEEEEVEDNGLETEAEDDTADMKSTLGDEFDSNDVKYDDTEEEPEAEEKSNPADSLTQDENDDSEFIAIKPEEDEEEKKKEESLEEEIEPDDQTCYDFFENFVEPENTETILVFDLDEDNAEEEIYNGSYEDLPPEILDSNFVGFDVAQGMLIVNIDSESEIDELTETVRTALDKFTDDFNDKISVWDQATGEEVFQGTKQSVIEQYGHNAFLSFESPERLQIKVRSLSLTDSLKTPYNEGLDLSDPKEKLIADILSENNLKEYNVDKYGSDEYWIADSIRNLADLDIIYKECIANKSDELILEFKDVTGYGEQFDELDEAAETNEQDVIAKAKELFKDAEIKAVIYGYASRGKFHELQGDLLEIRNDRELALATELVKAKYHPTGSVKVLYRENLEESIDCKNRKDLTEAIQDCKAKGIHYTIKRSVKEGYRYTLLKEQSFFDDEVVSEEKDADLADAILRVSNDIAQVFNEKGAATDIRLIALDLLNDLHILTNPSQELKDTPVENFRDALVNALTGFYAALANEKSFETGEDVNAADIRNNIDYVTTADEFKLDGLRNRFRDITSETEGVEDIPGVKFPADLEDDAEEENAEDTEIEVDELDDDSDDLLDHDNDGYFGEGFKLNEGLIYISKDIGDLTDDQINKALDVWEKGVQDRTIVPVEGTEDICILTSKGKDYFGHRADIDALLHSTNESLDEAKKDDELPADPEVVKTNVHATLNNLVTDEIEAINGYEEAKAEIADTHIEHKDDIIDTIDHIEDEEQEHIDELIDAASEIPFDKDEEEKSFDERKEEVNPLDVIPEEEQEAAATGETEIEYDKDGNVIPSEEVEEKLDFDETKFEKFINEWFNQNVEDTQVFEAVSGNFTDDGTIILEGKLISEDKEQDITFTLTPNKEMNEDLMDSKKVTSYTITSTSLPEGLVCKLNEGFYPMDFRFSSLENLEKFIKAIWGNTENFKEHPEQLEYFINHAKSELKQISENEWQWSPVLWSGMLFNPEFEKVRKEFTIQREEDK